MELAVKQNPQYKSDNLWIWPTEKSTKSEGTPSTGLKNIEFGKWINAASNGYVSSSFGNINFSFTEKSMTTSRNQGWSGGVAFDLKPGTYKLSGHMDITNTAVPRHVFFVNHVKIADDRNYVCKNYIDQLVPSDGDFSTVFKVEPKSLVIFVFLPYASAGDTTTAVTISNMYLREM